MWQGIISFAMTEVFSKSSEMYTTVYKKPKIGVRVTDAFNTNQLVISCLTRTLQVVHRDGTKAKEPPKDLKVFRNLYVDNDGNEVFIVPKSDLKWPATEKTPTGSARTEVVQNLPAFWAIKEETDPEKANAATDTKTVHVKIGANQFSIDVPIVKNTKPLKADDEIIVLSKCAPSPSEEPPAKRHKGASKGGQAKSKGKAKAKGKGKAKARR